MPMNVEDLNAVKRLTEPVASEIANLSDRIEQNRAAVSANETATRNYLIEPLLRSLGWDIADPDLVRPEYSAGHGRVDYALMCDGTPILLIEAKKLGTKLTADTLLQAFGYVDDKSVEFVAISNGDDWQVYRTPLSNRETIATFAVTDDSADATALEAAKLSRHIMTATIGQGEVAPSAVSGGTTQRENTDEDGQSSKRIEREPDPTVAHSDGKWVNLRDPDFNPEGFRPIRLMIDGEEISAPVGKGNKRLKWDWPKILVAVATWMIKNQQLSRNDCPIKKFPNGEQYLINTDKVHANENKFRAPKDLPRGMFMDTHGGTDQVVGFCRGLLRDFYDPDASVQIEPKKGRTR